MATVHALFGVYRDNVAIHAGVVLALGNLRVLEYGEPPNTLRKKPPKPM
jgi:hypothetical protein